MGPCVKKEKYQDSDVGEAFRVTVTRTVIRYDLVAPERIKKETELDGLFSFRHGNLVLLTVAQINVLNRLIRGQGEETPPDPSDIDDESLYRILHAGRPKSVSTFVQNEPVVLEETRYVEFKEVLGANVVNSIKATADEYAVALLNREGGRVFWGIRNTDRVVVGLKLTYSQRDEIKREVAQKVSAIQPPVSLQEFSLDYYAVLDDKGQEIPDLYVFELDVPRGSPTQLYATASHVVWIKTDAGKQRLTHDQVVAEVLRRKGF